MLVVAGILVITFIMVMHSSIPFGQRSTSSDGFSELEVNGTGHLDCLCLYDLCEAEEVLQRECGQALVFCRAMTGKPGDHCSSIFLILDISSDKTGRDSAFAKLTF